jgi:hypothetical protein
MARMFNQGVSVFGSCPPVSVVATGVGDSETTAVGLADGVSEVDAEGLADADALGVTEAVGVLDAVADAVGVAVAVGVTAAAHTSLVIVLVSRVTAPLLANS